jgi:hypothetical protein
MTNLVSRFSRNWGAVPWVILGALTAYWIGFDPDHMWADIHPLFWVPLVAAPSAVGLAFAVARTQWLSLVGAVGLLAVGPIWMWSLVGLPTQGQLFAIPPPYLVAGVVWLTGLATAFRAMVMAGRHGWLGSLAAVAIVWAVFVGLAVLRGALTH